MTRIMIGSNATYGLDGYWTTIFDNWRLGTLFINAEWELTEQEYYAKLHSELEKIGAVYVKDTQEVYLEFARDEDATMFVLRWS